MFDKNERVIRKPKISLQLQINITTLFIRTDSWKLCVRAVHIRIVPTTLEKLIRGAGGEKRGDDILLRDDGWRQILICQWTILRFVYCLCPAVLPNHSNDQVGFVRVEIRIETGSKLPRLSPPRIRIKTRLSRFPRAVAFHDSAKRISNFGCVLSLGRDDNIGKRWQSPGRTRDSVP